jgi:hypothetical protein
VAKKPPRKKASKSTSGKFKVEIEVRTGSTSPSMYGCTFQVKNVTPFTSLRRK